MRGDHRDFPDEGGVIITKEKATGVFRSQLRRSRQSQVRRMPVVFASHVSLKRVSSRKNTGCVVVSDQLLEATTSSQAKQVVHWLSTFTQRSKDLTGNVDVYDAFGELAVIV